MARTDGADTKARIVDTAVRLFAEGGASSIGMRELAKASDLTLPGLYYHFRSKQELVRAIFDRHASNLLATPSTKAAAAVGELVRLQGTADLEEMTDDFVRLVVLEAIGADLDAIDTLIDIRDGWNARWAKALAGATDLVPEADVVGAARAVTTALLGIYLLRLTGLPATDVATIDDLADTVGRGLSIRT